jgi:SAM-dependent methyltransferase
MTESKQRNFKDHFSGVASGYAAHRPNYPIELADFLANVAPGRRLAWDCGCGTGQLSTLLAARFEQVIATDASAEQIQNATPHPGVDYRCAPAEASGLPDSAVDLAAAAQAAHWFDVTAYYAEVKRVARPRAIVALVTYNLAMIDARVDPILRRFYSEALRSYWPPERRLVEAGYRSLPFPFDEIDAPRLEIRALWTLGDLRGYVETWSALRAMEKAAGRTEIENFYRDLAAVWGSEGEVRPVRWPLTLRVGRL